MFRFLGFLVGSAASIGIIVWLLGVPRLESNTATPRNTSFEGEMSDEMPLPPPLALAGPEEYAPPETGISAAPEPAAPESDAPATSPYDAPHAEAREDVPAERRWHAFWTPFRSEIAARGFVTRLERVTGLDYRIVKVKNGVYEVSFAYGTDVELNRKLSEIHAATGLDLQAE